MFTIRLNKMQFFAYHGMHVEEAIVGTDFEVSVLISFSADKKIIDITDTLNYVAVYEIVKRYFDTPEKLLETLAQNITEEIYRTDKRISSINITIDKLNPPICNFTGNVGVNYLKLYP